MEKLESENVSLEFQVHSLTKERENIKSEYQKLFDSIQKTRIQTQGEINELIENVNQKTYAYAEVRAQNQDLFITISELKAKLKNVEKAASSVRRPSNRDSPFNISVLSNTKNSLEKVKVSVRTNKKTYVASKNVVSNKKIVTNADVKNALKAKDVLCVSFSKTRFSVKTTQSKSLDTTSVVSKTKIVAVTPLSAKNKVSSAFKTITDILRDETLSKYMKNTIRTSRMWQKWYELQPNVGWSPIKTTPTIVNSRKTVNTLVPVKKMGARESNLCTISISDMAASSLVCLMSKATLTKSWLWHCRLSHLNFSTINDLTKHDLVDGLSKFNHAKVDLCFQCKLELLHMDLCEPVKVASINGKKYILVIVDDYSRLTWVYFLHTKDETPEIIKNFIARVQLNYNAKVHKIRTDNGTEFKNATLKAHYEKLGIMQQFLIAQMPQQNGVVERHNRTLVEVARTMLVFS
ncbi:retrovirus-related pol polyprotein from transposon TNT 1-94 [Tanacetum coccineum]|uniref:Retrovirus-related pol polyprotein from transposon TNT 1-94 n=1 Tax=Tanacetum coccineum TaxID=301880 RepID=A0ABQ5HML2_9ASTR